jgi:hypothetical protein
MRDEPRLQLMQLRKVGTAILTALFVTGCATSSHTIVGQVRAPIDPGDVEIYTSPPRRYEEIALLDASSVGSLGRASEGGTDEAIYRMKEDAAKLGANGVLLTGIADQYGGSLGVGVGGFGVSGGRSHVTAGGGSVGFGGPIMHKGVQGVAIYVPGRR